MSIPVTRETTVAVVEDDAEIRTAWVRILNRLSGYRCIGDYATAEEAIRALRKCPPEIVLMDINLPGMSGIECTRELKQFLPDLEVVMLTMFGDRDRLFDALSSGASGYLLKRTTPGGLKAALDETRAGGSPMSPQIARQVVQYFQNRTPPVANAAETASEKLSERESEILRLLAEGRHYKEIAVQLALSLDTVRTYIRRIYHKLQVHSRTEAVVKFLSREAPPAG